MGIEAPLPTRILVKSEEIGEGNERIPALKLICAVASESMFQSLSPGTCMDLL